MEQKTRQAGSPTKKTKYHKSHETIDRLTLAKENEKNSDLLDHELSDASLTLWSLLDARRVPIEASPTRTMAVDVLSVSCPSGFDPGYATCAVAGRRYKQESTRYAR